MDKFVLGLGHRRVADARRCAERYLRLLRAAAIPVLVGAGLSMPEKAEAGCNDIPNILAELPATVRGPDVVLTFAYNLEQNEYSVRISRGEQSFLYDHLLLERNCRTGARKWTFDGFLMLETSCGSFCWGAELLSTTAQRRYGVSRPIEYDVDRKLVVSYPDWDVVEILSLVTGHRQTFETVKHCESSAEVCFTVRFEKDDLVYTWQDDTVFPVTLDRELFE